MGLANAEEAGEDREYLPVHYFQPCTTLAIILSTHLVIFDLSTVDRRA